MHIEDKKYCFYWKIPLGPNPTPVYANQVASWAFGSTGETSQLPHINLLLGREVNAQLTKGKELWLILTDRISIDERKQVGHFVSVIVNHIRQQQWRFANVNTESCHQYVAPVPA